MHAYEKARQLVLVMLKGIPHPTPEDIKANVKLVADMLRAQGLEEFDDDYLTRDIESRVVTWRGSATVLDDNRNDHKAWLPYKKSKIDWRFWKRYERFLMEERGLSETGINKLDELTDKILERLEDPKREESWDRRGMIVGQIQSGKTSNYIGLVCKAADAGYNLIIILAGMHKSLRSQTQYRIDEGFLGFDTRLNRAFDKEKNLRMGVGALPGEEIIAVNSLTSSEDRGDFNRKVASQVGVIPGGSDPVILVVKKNKSVLKNLINWAVSVRGEEDLELRKTIVRGIPLLVIDDEADNASVNTNPIPLNENGQPLDDYDVSAINGQIRKLLNSFEKSAYIGYTATPFANIFIFPQGETTTYGEDLFPRDFIMNLPAPSNYIGPTEIFGLHSESEEEMQLGFPIIKTIDDYQRFLPDNHTKEFVPEYLPDSLKKAIKSFILSSAIRMARGERNNHNSMLVHVTRYTAVQEKIKQLILDEMTALRRKYEYENNDSPNHIIHQFEAIFYSDFISTMESMKNLHDDSLMTEVTWDQMSDYIFDVISRIQVKVINGTARDALDYIDHPEGLSVIAVGGDKLSRGLTLEGLSLSYYLRASRMYDTLMQMGRWFGYRPGYADLCRLYTSRELEQWYRHINFASEELRREFDYMAALNATPADYGLRVRTHPDGLLITAVNKMRSGTLMDLSYANSVVETVIFHKDESIINTNLRLIDQFIHDLGSESENVKNNFIWCDIPTSKILSLLSEFVVHPESRKAKPDLLYDYIQKQLQKGELTSWTVALINNTRAEMGHSITIGGRNIGLTKRTDQDSPYPDKYVMKKGRLISPSDEYLDLSEEQIKEALKLMENDPDRIARSLKTPNEPSGPYLRTVRPAQKGLLLIYPLDPEEPKVAKPIIGLAFSIPKSDNVIPIQYKVNNIYWEQEFAN